LHNPLEHDCQRSAVVGVADERQSIALAATTKVSHRRMAVARQLRRFAVEMSRAPSSTGVRCQ
jgi:hypothetical protein